LQGKLLAAFLVDAQLVTAERISPWGYTHWQSEPQPVCVARDLIHA